MNFRPRKKILSRPPSVLRHIPSNQPSKSNLSLPNLSLYNTCSLFPKIASPVTDMEERTTDICFITEIWEQDESKKHRKKVEKLLELKGIKYISNPGKNRRRGGAAIAVSLKNYTISKLNVHIPALVECVWGLLKPINPSSSFSSFVCCCLYSPPDLHGNIALIDHISVTIQALLNTHKNAGVFICGDQNQIDVASLLATDPSLSQIVCRPTLGSNTLDVTCTNLPHLYKEPLILPALIPDNPSLGVPSDHFE